jgi:hypothetical protein
MSTIRTFSSGASRNPSAGKPDYEGFLSPLVLERYAQFLHKHRQMEDGSLRDSDNWQKGIPITEYMKSLWRHFMDVWKHVRGIPCKDTFEDALCAVIFNASGMLFERLKGSNASDAIEEMRRRYPEMFITRDSYSPVPDVPENHNPGDTNSTWNKWLRGEDLNS